ncbi:hypothetical protein PV797_06325 [Clostridiaceae bacterium M8S5]|nr:hypothetical protein PV797_06325 [Clostridiaceae bacterium M8S5]
MKNPFLFNEKIDLAIIDANADQSLINYFKNRNIDIIKTVKCNDILEPIAYHPDMVMHPVNPSTIVVAPNVYNYYKELLKNKPLNIIRGEKVLSRNYPDDIAYNVARVQNYAVHKIEKMDTVLKYYFEKENIQFVNVKQGYTKCSTAIISEKAVITSDATIHKKLTQLGIDVCYIKEGFIELPGFDYGFIGGATFCLNQNEVSFSGKLIDHPNIDEIFKFIKKYGKEPNFLSLKKIIDIGSIITLRYN